MAIYIRVCSGPEQGTSFQIRNGLKIGRKNADFIIGDRSASGLHATIRETKPGSYALVDNDSKNGTKVNGEREDFIDLEPGLSFWIGNTEFKVVKSLEKNNSNASHNLESDVSSLPPGDGEFEFDEPSVIKQELRRKEPGLELKTPHNPDATNYVEKFDSDTPMKSAHEKAEPKSRKFNTQQPEDSEVSEPLPAEIGLPEDSKIIEVEIKQSWNEILEEFSQTVLPNIKNNLTKIVAFNPAVKLKFIRGVQTDTVWTLGYGPRRVGSHEYDLTIFEPDAPAACFELIPKENSVVFKSSHLKKVLLNGAPCEQATLKDGDVIDILDTSIKVELIP